MIQLMQKSIRAMLISGLVYCWGLNLQCQANATAPGDPSPSVLGTWKGESICVGTRPACKNEVVVYRFELVAGKPGIVVVLADKIIEGKRVPMGKLEFQYDQAKGELLCDFTTKQTHGLWHFTVSGDTIEGTLVLLPDRELARRVKVKRANAEEVPETPARDLYEDK